MSGVFTRNSLEHAVAGSSGTVLATLLLFPLERLKTLLQVEQGSGLWQLLARVLRDEGPSGLYRGCTPMLQTVGASNFLYFFLFEGLKEPLASATGQPEGVVGPYETLAASAVAGSLNMVVTEPLWRACVVAQAQTRSWSWNSDLGGACASSKRIMPNQGVFRTVCNMWAKEGPGALWRGLGSSLWLVTNPVIQFFAYDLLKASLSDDVSTLRAFAMGAIAKALATVATFPLQVAQSRLRAARERGVGAGEAPLPPELRGMVPCLLALFRANGFSSLYIGLGTKLLQTVTTTAFMFAFYEKIHYMIRRAARKGLRRTWRRGAKRLR